jgi:citrate lyase beta subunit
MERQPIHTVYGGAHLFKPDIATALGSTALETLQTYAPDPPSLGVSDVAYDRVVRKLKCEPVEDYRIDFEDGYGVRPDAEEDGHAVSVAQAVRRGLSLPGFPPFLGIRIKPFTSASRARSMRTLKLFLDALGDIPPNFVVTLAKVTEPGQVTELVRLLSPYGALKLELMIETPQSIIDPSGQIAIPKLIDAAEGRCRGLHFGVYDYTASCEIIAEHQSITHPACDFARHMMQVSSAGRGVTLSDGATNILPVPVHRGANLTSGQGAENREAVRRAMKLHFEHVQRSLAHGFYQGWDLHPAQLPTRYAAVYSFFQQSFDSAAARLRNFIQQSERATLVGSVFDDAATGEGLMNFFRRGLNCGAFSEEDVAQRGLTITRRG